MQQRISPARMAAALLAATLTIGVPLAALAQAPAAKPAEKKPAAKPATPAKPAAPAPAPQAQAPANGAPTAQNGQQPNLMYSPWIKICNKGNEPNAKQVCVTAKDGRLENGMPVAAAALIEPQGEARKLIRITVPLGMQLQHGTRLIVDQEAPATAPYFMCFPNGCMADYEANADMVGKLKKGHTLTIQAINMQGQAISLPLPLADFAKAYDGPPTDPKVFEEQQRKLQEELQKKAEEARKKLEAQQPSAAAPAAPAPKQ
ncbi:MAG TPA: invasion associated locus B family protein [Pseudolabrys sp.]|nr:invasion associated locus B family protein [Pseudolabrys sp.]